MTNHYSHFRLEGRSQKSPPSAVQRGQSQVLEDNLFARTNGIESIESQPSRIQRTSNYFI